MKLFFYFSLIFLLRLTPVRHTTTGHSIYALYSLLNSPVFFAKKILILGDSCPLIHLSYEDFCLHFLALMSSSVSALSFSSRMSYISPKATKAAGCSLSPPAGYQCTMRSLYSISISQPNKLGPILKVAQCDII